MTAQKGSAFLLKIGDGASAARPTRPSPACAPRRCRSTATPSSSPTRKRRLARAAVGRGDALGLGQRRGDLPRQRRRGRDPRPCAGRHARRLRTVVRGRREAARPLPGPAARLCRRFQRRAQLHAAARKLAARWCRHEPRGQPLARRGGAARRRRDASVLRPTSPRWSRPRRSSARCSRWSSAPATGQLRLAELAALFWHCLAERDGADPRAGRRGGGGNGLAALRHAAARAARRRSCRAPDERQR